MGSTLEFIRGVLRDSPNPEIGTSVWRAHTGRVSNSFTAEEQVCERLVNSWLDGRIDIGSVFGLKLVQELVRDLPRCSVPATYRARFFPRATHPTSPLQFGPPPGNLSKGRYNRVGQSALYLSADLFGLKAEMGRSEDDTNHLYYARYHPVDSLSVVDLSDTSIHAALQLAFDRAERLDTPYETSQKLADVVRSLGIDGMIVPGVRGNPDHHYRNVVLFNCKDWEKWVDTSHPPQNLINCVGMLT